MSPPQLRRGHLAVWNLEARAPGQARQIRKRGNFLTDASPAPPSGPHSRACARRVRPRRGPFGIETPPGEVNSPFGKFLRLRRWNLRRRRRCPRRARAPGQAPQAGSWERFLTGASPAPPSGPHSRACARRVRPRRGPFGIETPPGEVNSPFGKFLRLRRWNLRRRRRCPRRARAPGQAPQAGSWERFLTGASPAPPSGPHSRACPGGRTCCSYRPPRRAG